uniref:Uncharacterized protein n=1 Tax=Daucus carota subsp. sativus TaxID=79200 RepID=A0A166DJJ6_DAUCS
MFSNTGVWTENFEYGAEMQDYCYNGHFIRCDGKLNKPPKGKHWQEESLSIILFNRTMHLVHLCVTPTYFKSTQIKLVDISPLYPSSKVYGQMSPSLGLFMMPSTNHHSESKTFLH